MGFQEENAMVSQWVGRERCVEQYDLSSELVTELAMNARRELVSECKGFDFFENPNEHIQFFKEILTTFNRHGYLPETLKKQSNTFLQNLKTTFENDCRYINVKGIVDTQRFAEPTNKYFLYQVYGEHKAFNTIRKATNPALQHEIGRNPSLISCINSTIRPAMRYPKHIEILIFMKLLHELFNKGLLPCKYASSTALFRSQLMSSFIEGRKVAYVAFNITDNNFHVSCANNYGYQKEIRKELAPAAFSHLVNTAKQNKQPWACPIKIVEAPDCSMQLIAAFDVHRFIIAGMEPDINFFNTKIAPNGLDWSLTDTAYQPLINMIQQAGFYWCKDVALFSRWNETGCFHSFSNITFH